MNPKTYVTRFTLQAKRVEGLEYELPNGKLNLYPTETVEALRAAEAILSSLGIDYQKAASHESWRGCVDTAMDANMVRATKRYSAEWGPSAVITVGDTVTVRTPGDMDQADHSARCHVIEESLQANGLDIKDTEFLVQHEGDAWRET